MHELFASLIAAPLGVLLPVVGGAVLGLVFYCGLWWTVRRAATFQHPGLSMLTSMLLRMGITLGGFYLVEAMLGLAYGIYVGVDLALVVDVLPNPDDAGKDLGVFNMANALPQSAAPGLGAALLAVRRT